MLSAIVGEDNSSFGEIVQKYIKTFDKLPGVRVLDRYILSIFIRNLLVSWLSMTALFLFQAIFANIFAPNYSVHQLVYYHLLNVPQIMIQIAGPSVLLATVLSLAGLSRTHELVACYAIGVSLFRIMFLILSVVVSVCLFALVMEDRVLPPFYRVRTNYYMRDMEKKQDFFFDIKRDKVWYRSKNMIYNLQRFDNRSKMIYGMSVYTFDDDFNLIQMVEAERAQFDREKWKLIHGTVTIFNSTDQFPMTQEFEEKEMQIAETPKDFQEIEKEVDGLRMKELLHYIQTVKNAGADTKSYEVKFHSRFSLSFIPIVMCFLAIPFSLKGRREGGVAKDLGLCLGVTFFYWLFYSVSLSLGTNGALPPWLAAWLPSAIFIMLAAVFIFRKNS